MNPLQLISSMIIAIGGSGAIVVGLGAWLGKIWSNRIIETEKARHARELSKLQSELEFERLRKQKISDEKFKLYSSLWHSLQDLKTIADRLWERATPETLNEFVKTLTDTRQAANRGRLILLEDHYQALQAVLESFENYRLGKKRLIEIRSREEITVNFGLYLGGDDEVTQQIHDNLTSKREYDILLEKIVKQFRLELGLSPEIDN